MTQDTRARENRRLVRNMLIVALGMFGFGFALVPVYNVICDITGLNGKTGQLAEAEAAARYEIDTSRTVTVEFVANRNADMPWDFAPEVTRMAVHPGAVYETRYIARNPTTQPMVGQAVPSVAPGKAARYFNKTECFCFSQQPLAAGESKAMPLRFIVDPALPRDVSTVSLSYTFFDITRQAAN